MAIFHEEAHNDDSIMTPIYFQQFIHLIHLWLISNLAGQVQLQVDLNGDLYKQLEYKKYVYIYFTKLSRDCKL